MRSRVVQPDTVRLSISEGDWIDVKKRLNAGESRRIFSRMVTKMQPGQPIDMDPMQVGRSQAVEYLLDWSLTDLPIRDKGPEVKGTALDSLDLDTFNEIVNAIAGHEKAMDAERSAEKNGQGGETPSSMT